MKYQKQIIIGAVVATLLWIVAKVRKPFSQIVDFQRIRGEDSRGNGAFGESRGDTTHQGVDIVVQPGQRIKSPITGKVVRYSDPYGDGEYSGYHLSNDKYLVKLWYLAPTLQEGQTITEGQIVGFAQNIAARYPGITPHVHMEVWDKTKMNTVVDPTNLFNV